MRQNAELWIPGIALCGIMRNHKMLSMRYYAELYASADSAEKMVNEEMT